jgi:hypothetical protein
MDKPAVARHTRWMWWLITVLLGIALVMDLRAGQPGSMATSALLFVGSLLSAAWPLPRPPAATGAIVLCFVAAVVLMIARAAGLVP